MTEINEETVRPRIQNYLEHGGLFNPEMMEHDKVRDLLTDCRTALIAKASETCEWMSELDTLLQDLFARLAGLVGCQQTDAELCLRVTSMLSKVQRGRKLIESKQEQGKKERTCL